MTPACTPTGDLRRPALCDHVRVCSCGAGLTLRPDRVERPGVTGWAWRDVDGRADVVTFPWGTGPEPDGYWESLARLDVATYSALAARANLGMLGSHHQHEPASPICGICPRPAGDVPPYCCGWPMWATVEGWRCREVTDTLVPYAEVVPA